MFKICYQYYYYNIIKLKCLFQRVHVNIIVLQSGIVTRSFSNLNVRTFIGKYYIEM